MINCVNTGSKNMKKLILASAILLAMAACSSDDNSSDLECSTSYTDDMARIFVSYKGTSEETVANHCSDENGEFSDVVKTHVYANSTYAARTCAALAAKWGGATNHYECEENVVIERYVRLDTRDEIREGNEYICNYLYQLDKNGTLDSLYKANGGM